MAHLKHEWSKKHALSRDLKRSGVQGPLIMEWTSMAPLHLLRDVTYAWHDRGLLVKVCMLLIVFFLANLCVLPTDQANIAVARVYHVDVNRGNDTFPGTQSEPFKTITHASNILKPGDKALIHPGVYHEQVMKGNSGRPGFPLTFEGTDRVKVVMDGSIRVNDWHRQGKGWTKTGLKPITHENAFVMVDEKRLLRQMKSKERMPPGSFHLADEGTYTIRMWDDSNPNSDHVVDVYELDLAFNAGDRWGGTRRSWIILRNLTLQKYGGHAISTDLKAPHASHHWELDRLTVRFNYHEGVFACLDDWFVHDCSFFKNRGHGCQLNGARIRFQRNKSSHNEWFGDYEHGGCGILIGPDATAHSCVIQRNEFKNNGDINGYGCGVYLEGRSHRNTIENNVITGSTHAGIGFYGSSYNLVRKNHLSAIAPRLSSPSAGAFIVAQSFEGEANFAEGNYVTDNTVKGSCTPIACIGRHPNPSAAKPNRFENNVFDGCRYRSRLFHHCVIEMKNNVFNRCPINTNFLGIK